MEHVDILKPPTFVKSGVTKPYQEAYDDEDWVGAFNLWVIRTEPELAFLFQLRTSKGIEKGIVGSGKLDLAVGGIYSSGEEGLDGLREAKEEIGKEYKPEEVIKLGRRINVSIDSKNRERHNTIYVYAVIDNSNLSTFHADADEIDALFLCKVDDFIELYQNPGTVKTIYGLDNNGNEISIEASKDSFYYNWDDYYLKMCVLAKRIMNNEDLLIL